LADVRRREEKVQVSEESRACVKLVSDKYQREGINKGKGMEICWKGVKDQSVRESCMHAVSLAMTLIPLYPMDTNWISM